ncbi:MAG: glyoxalase/bleomycin resistance/extradiol dioxygenase family protein [Acidobacteriia bacterium]|nr:glyoxalase/bleomycin resistance/extradiol dioxygenase family protein [Terriglobia bacterium]
MKLSVHLTFCGECEVAFLFYAQCLGGRIVTMLPYGQSPLASQVPEEWHGKILHASMVTGDLELAGADVAPGDFERPQGFFTLLEIPAVAEAERIFQALAEGGIVRLVLQKTFWAERFGVLVDRFGIPWEINCPGDQAS